MPTGKIGEFSWAQHWDRKSDLLITDIVRALRTHLLGRRAVNVSWDSGRLSPPLSGIFERWQSHDDFVISPPVDDTLISDWPRSSCGWDEWYFFRSIPKSISLEAYCNWGGMAIGDWRQLEFTGLSNNSRLTSQSSSSHRVTASSSSRAGRRPSRTSLPWWVSPNKALKQTVGTTVFSAANGRILRSQQPPAA